MAATLPVRPLGGGPTHNAVPRPLAQPIGGLRGAPARPHVPARAKEAASGGDGQAGPAGGLLRRRDVWVSCSARVGPEAGRPPTPPTPCQLPGATGRQRPRPSALRGQVAVRRSHPLGPGDFHVPAVPGHGGGRVLDVQGARHAAGVMGGAAAWPPHHASRPRQAAPPHLSTSSQGTGLAETRKGKLSGLKKVVGKVKGLFGHGEEASDAGFVLSNRCRRCHGLGRTTCPACGGLGVRATRGQGGSKWGE